MTTERILLRGARSTDGDRRVDLLLEGGVIAAIGDVPAADRILDLDGLLVAPGFVDAQINGGFGRDFTTDPTSIWHVGERLRTYGVTAYLPTLVSTDLETIDAARRVVGAGPPPGYAGAAVWGLHVEGPFLAPARCGAHDPSKLRLPSPELVAGWAPEWGVAMVTLAPELPGALDTIAALVAQGVVVSLGHSDADYEQAVAGFDAGARGVTHLFNAMSGMAHRSPGLATAALTDGRVTASMIVDHIHLHPGTTCAAWNALGPQRTMLITDAIAAFGAGATAERSRLGGENVAVTAGAPRLASGTLAGSVLSLDTAVRNLRAATNASIADVVASVTSVPAALLGRDRRVEVGTAADLTILDEELSVVATVVGGHVDAALSSREV